MDIFGAPAPSFNIRGEAKVRTNCGGVVTSAILSVTLLFSIVKFQHLITKHNPAVTAYQDKNSWGTADMLRPGSIDDFMMAFAVTSHREPRTVKHDPSFVKWISYQRNVANGEETSNEVPLHKCTDEEYGRFAEPEDDDTVRQVEEIKASGGFMCVDWRDVQLSFAKNWAADQSTVEVLYLPCNSENSAYYLEDRTYENCNDDKAKLLEYLNGLPVLIVYQNTARFNINQYGDQSIKKESVMTVRRSNVENSWTRTRVRHNMLEDETGLLQLGIAK